MAAPPSLPSSFPASALPLPSININLEPTIGAFLIGGITSVGLTGVTTLQCWLYFLKYPKDPIFLKLLVLITWLLEMLRSSVCIHAGYFYSVRHWGDLAALPEPTWSVRLMIMLTNVIELIVHGFFIHKVWRATRGRAKFLCGLITFFAAGDFALGTLTYVTSSSASTIVDIHADPEKYATAALGCAIGADWLITGSLVKFFRDNKSQFPQTNHLVNKLIFYAVNMGLLTSLADVATLLLANIPWPSTNFYQLAFFEIVGNLYANMLLACLNARYMSSDSEELELEHPIVPTAHDLTGSMETGRPHTGSSQSRISKHAWTATPETHSSVVLPVFKELPNTFFETGVAV